MSAISMDLMTVAKKVNNYIEDATDNDATNAKFESTTLQTYTVPANKRWIFLYGCITRDASATLIIKMLDSSGNLINQFTTVAAAAGIVTYISPINSGFVQGAFSLMIMDPGEQITLAFGAAQGAGATASCVVLEIDV